MMKRCHFIGIGGIGMSGLARILIERNVDVSGSDLVASSITKNLQQMGADISFGHSSRNISPTKSVVFSTDIKEDNPEFKAAVKLKCRMFHRSELLLYLMKDYKTLAVTGTHGKTSTSALLAWVLCEGGLDPSFAVGGVLSQFHSNAKHGKGEYFVAEADESDGSFLRYQPHGAIVTNIGLDHMNYYQTDEALVHAFSTFMEKVENSDLLFWCGDDGRLRELSHPGVTYGFDEGCQLRATNFQQQGWSSTFDVTFGRKRYPALEVALTGRHNVLNALAVFGLALRLGMDEQNIRRALKNFGGVARRCEKKGEARGVLFIDDYAHHPTEISATLRAIRDAVKGRRLIAVFQPHRFTRTESCFGGYGRIFDDVNALFVTDIHSAGEPPLPGVTSEKILDEVKRSSKVSCRYVSHENMVTEISDFLRPHDVVVSLGAGSITNLGPELMRRIGDD